MNRVHRARNLTARSHAQYGIWLIILEFGAAPVVGLSAVRPDKEQPSCRL